MKEPKKQPNIGECANLNRILEGSHYGVPEGIFMSALRKDKVEYIIVFSKDGSEKDIITRDWYFRFRRGGKNKGWLCFDFLVY